MDALIGIIGTVLGVAIGGGISLFTQNVRIQHERSLSSSKRRIEKLEQIHELLTTIEFRNRRMFSEAALFLQFGRKSDAEKENERMPFEELDMLVSFYASPLTHPARKLVDSCQEYGTNCLRAIVNPPKSENEKATFENSLLAEYQSIRDQIEGLKQSISELAQSCAN